MSQGGYSHTTRATGTVLTAAIYNADHQNHITNQNPVMTGGYSDNLTQMQLTQNPGSLGTENLAATLAGEIERLRYQMRLITGEPQWYVPPTANLKMVGGTIADNSLPLTKLVNTTQGKLMGRVSAGVGPWQEFDIPTLTALTPTPTDVVLGSPLAGGAFRRIAVADLSAAAAIANPQGRLSIVSNTPIMTSNVTDATVLYYVPYTGHQVPIWNGTQLIAANTGGQLQQLLNDTTKSPAAAQPDRCYDIFFWMDGTTPRISRGPAWSDLQTRGVGVGSTELTRIAGLLVNAQAITNGPAANRGTYLGTVRTWVDGLLDWLYSTSGVGATPCQLNVWNYYNRLNSFAQCRDIGTQYTYLTNAFRGPRGGATMRIYHVVGLFEDYAVATYSSHLRGVVANSFPRIAMGYDDFANTNIGAIAGVNTSANNTDAYVTTTAEFGLAIGAHTLTALEASDGVNNNLFNVSQTQLLSCIFRM